AEELGLVPIEYSESFCRHPLAYLVEASDDICYLLADLEDGYETRLFAAREVEDLFAGLIPPGNRRSLERIAGNADRISSLRPKAIGALIDETVEAFLGHEAELLEGKLLQKGLLRLVSTSERIEEIRRLSQERLYDAPKKLEAEVAGY